MLRTVPIRAARAQLGAVTLKSEVRRRHTCAYLRGHAARAALTPMATAFTRRGAAAVFVPFSVKLPAEATALVMVALLGGLQSIPKELHEAAEVDGATAWQRFYRVMLPLMKPAILVALLFRTLDAFRIFDNIYVLTAGGSGTYSVSILGYDNLFTALNLGIGSAISILIFICVAIIAFLFIRGFGAAVPGSTVGGR